MKKKWEEKEKIEKRKEKENKRAEKRENIRKFPKILVFYMDTFQKIYSPRNLKKF